MSFQPNKIVIVKFLIFNIVLLSCFDRSEIEIKKNIANKKVIKQIDSLLMSAYKFGEPGVSVIISKKGKILLRKGYGKSNLELNVNITPETVFRIGSLTKQFTATGILLLANEKKLSIDDPIESYLPSLPNSYNDVKIKHLLTHTSGIVDYQHTDEFDNLIQNKYYDMVNEDLDSKVIFEILSKYNLEFQPGSQFSYSNSGYFLIGQIINKISNQSMASFLEEMIFQDLKMYNTRFFSSTDIIKNRATGYTDINGKIILNPHINMESNLYFPSGGIMSTVDDLFKWHQVLIHDSLFSKLAENYFFKPYLLNDGTESIYGMGYFIHKLKNQQLIFHNGDVSGYSSSMLYLPDDDIFIVLLGNSDLYSLFSSRYHENIGKRIAAILMGNPFPDFDEQEIAVDSLTKYTGTYIFEKNIMRKIGIEANRLYVQRNNGRKVPLLKSINDTFFFKNYLIYISFEYDKDKNVRKMTMHYDDGRNLIGIKED